MPAWGLRHGDPHGRTADGDSPCLSITACEPVAGYGQGAYRLAWTWSRGVRWGYRHGHRWGRAPVWFKIYVNDQLRETTRATSYLCQLRDGEDPRFQVVVTGPLNGDADYDPSLALEVVPGNRAQLTWSPPSPLPSDLSHFLVYSNGGSGDVDWDTAVGRVEADGSASYSWTSEPLADGSYRYGVRAIDEAGNADPNTSYVTVAIASWPAAPTGLAYEYDPDEDKVTLTWSGGATVNVYGGSGDIDYDTPVASAVTSPWTSSALTGPGTFKFGVRAVSGGREEQNCSYVEFELDAAEEEVSRPGEPFGLTVTPAADGTFTVAGFYDPRRPTLNGRQPAVAASVKIYHDNGTGAMDWVTPLATVSLSAVAGGVYRFTHTTVAGYTHGLAVQFGARAATSGGTVGTNTETASGTADAVAPGSPVGLAGAAVSDTEATR